MEYEIDLAAKEERDETPDQHNQGRFKPTILPPRLAFGLLIHIVSHSCDHLTFTVGVINLLFAGLQ
jgi:hypothetical protein